VRFIGDQVAVVVAQSEADAQSAIRLIKVEYEDLPVLSDPVEAMKPGAYIFIQTSEIQTSAYITRFVKETLNPLFKNADVVIEGEYRAPVQEHAYLQPEAGLSYIDEDGRITILCAGQWTHADQESIAHALGYRLKRCG